MGFYSRKLDETQLHWPAYDLELFAVYSAVEHFELMIAGRELTIATDHRPITYLFSTKKKIKLERRLRWAEYIAQFTSNIIHVSGIANVVADALSRPEPTNEICQISAKITPKDIAEAQKNDDEIIQMRRYGFRDQNLKEKRIDDTSVLLCSHFGNEQRPVVPESLRLPIFQQVHNVGHYGLKASLRLIRSKYYWPNMTKDIRNWQRACRDCQLVKTQRHTVPEIGTFPKCEKFEHVHVDLVGPLKPSAGYTYLCTFIDRTSRWIEAIPMKTIIAEKVAQIFYTHWVARYGTPLQITSDRGPQFRSDLFLELSKLLGAQHVQTTAYHPQANGLVERFHRRLKELLTCYGANWNCYLPSILLGLRAAPRDETGVSCAEMAFGQTLRLPGELHESSNDVTDSSEFVKHLRTILREIKPAPFLHRRKQKIFVHKDLQTCKRVYVRVDKVRTSLEPPFKGPYEVIRRHKLYYEVDVDGKKDTVSISRLKPAYELDLEDESVDETSKPPTIKPILKVKGTSPSQVREGKTKENTLFNSKVIYVNDNPHPIQPPNRFPEDLVNIQIDNNPPSPPPAMNQEPLVEANHQNQVRQSTRVRKLPNRFKDFVV